MSHYILSSPSQPFLYVPSDVLTHNFKRIALTTGAITEVSSADLPAVASMDSLTKVEAIQFYYAHLNDLWIPDSGYQFRLERSTRQSWLGWCDYDQRIIAIDSVAFTANPLIKVVDILRHEIAHALVGSRAAHGPDWQTAAIRLAAYPRACQQDRSIMSAKSVADIL